jgi:serine/alanine adding enzyme
MSRMNATPSPSARPMTSARSRSQTIAWNIRHDDLMESMHAHHRRAVRKADRAGIEVRIGAAPADLQGFQGLYEETMRRQEARAFYFFPDAYWEALVDRCSENLLLLEAVLDGVGVAAILCFVSPPYLHYHLGASHDAGRHVGASNRLFLAAAQWGRERDLIVFHLGGGVRGASDSPLFVFKQRFDPSAAPLDFHVGRWVHDLPQYRRLTSATSDSDFFPPWR